jgi:ABC-type ATPase involved in cell division
VSITLTPEPKSTVRTPVSAHVEAPARIPETRQRPAQPAGPPALLLEHVGKTFTLGRKKKAVAAILDVSLRVERAEIYGVLGANGSGKSTLIRLVSTLLTLDTGRAEVFGHDVERDEMAVKRLINRVSVDAAFFKKLSPYENLAFAARLYGLHAGDARREAVRILARLGISEKRMGSPIEHAAEGRDRAGAADLADAPPARRADDRPRPALQARGPGLRGGPPGDARRHDPPHDA